MEAHEPPATAQVEILIRKPAADVFSAFTDRDKLTQFWLSGSSASLAPGATAQWDFMVEGASVGVQVRAFEKDRRLLVDWSDGTTVEWRFATHGEGTVVTVVNAGFQGSAAQRIARALDSTQGFAFVLCDLKTLLEGGRSSHIVRDKALLIEGARGGSTSDRAA